MRRDANEREVKTSERNEDNLARIFNLDEQFQFPWYKIKKIKFSKLFLE